jgi:hypothetical protein
MPLLKICAADFGDRHIMIYLESVMLFPAPQDADRRSEVEIAGLDGLAEDQANRSPAPPPRDAQERFLRAQAYRMKHIQKETQERYRRGVTAGLILEAALNSKPRSALPSRIGKSVKWVENVAWPSHRCVSHLWMAHGILNRRYYALGAREIVFPCKLDHVEQFLSMAEACRRQGETFRPTRSRHGPLLRAEQTWQAPQGLGL